MPRIAVHGTEDRIPPFGATPSGCPGWSRTSSSSGSRPARTTSAGHPDEVNEAPLEFLS